MYVKKEFVEPKVGRHPSGQAYVTWNRKAYYLGKWSDPPSPTIEAKKQRLFSRLRELYAAGSAGIEAPDDPLQTPVMEGVLLYLDYLKTAPDGARNRRGKLNADYYHTRLAAKPLVALKGFQACNDIRIPDLVEVRDSIAGYDPKGRPVFHSWWKPEEHPDPEDKPPKTWSRQGINKRMAALVRMFRWFQLRGIVDGTRWNERRVLPYLRKGKTTAPEARHPTRTADETSFLALLKYCSPQIRAIAEVQHETSARPSEICIMRGCRIERTADVWEYRPDWFKTESLAKDPCEERVIFLNSRCQEILKPFLDRDPEAYLFSPAESWRWWHEQRPKAQPGAGRKTKLYEFEIQRRAKQRAATAAAPKRQFNDYFSEHGYGQQIRRAYEKAKKAGEDVAYWTPYCLRHKKSQDTADRFGEEVAQAKLGHKHLSTTKIYTKRRNRRAKLAAMIEDLEYKIEKEPSLNARVKLQRERKRLVDKLANLRV